MSTQYNAQRKRNIFGLKDNEPFKLSRSKIEAYLKCSRCFYLDRKCGTEQPPMYPYTLNNAVDSLLKKEFDQYRIQGQKHPCLTENNIDAIPFSHENLNDWRMNQRGIKFYHETTNFLVHGAVDDIWINPKGELIIVDYKATSVQSEVSLNNRESYKRQMEIYQWLFRKNGFMVSNTGYFFYCNGDTTKDNFTNVLPFKISILPYEGDDSWIENILFDIRICLTNNTLPEQSKDCNYCNYWYAVNTHVEKYKKKSNSSWLILTKKVRRLIEFFCK